MAGLAPALRTCCARSSLRALRSSTRTFTTATPLRNQGPGTGENREQANDPAPRKETPNVSKTNELGVTASGNRDGTLQETTESAEKQRQMQAPNRAGVWSRSQQPREVAMSGPRFEQTIMDLQPQPYAAIDLIHKQPVRWVDGKQTSCDGGGGPLGHPRIFINVDKPQICWCTYCGLPYAKKAHKEYLQSLPSTTYPLAPTNDPVQVQMPQTPSQKGEIDGHYPALKGEVDAQSVAGAQR
ncbi:Lactobacillus shifted protein [Cyphellophora attinorum]|uniref:Lactobacillus shifted protein n=1 Tax=Cyphellophora attinorum TaxID=1664694 RepID=A0A0N0NI33_9EURO|nr:Lactobacillus shifted protein [Phialophora attinorum]KPI34979.1 Lactobacillus shifted protein [Phialophora attinorum]